MYLKSMVVINAIATLCALELRTHNVKVNISIVFTVSTMYTIHRFVCLYGQKCDSPCLFPEKAGTILNNLQ